MRTDRWLIGAGFGFLLIAGSTFIVGTSGFPIVAFVALALGSTLMIIALGRSRGRPQHETPRDPERAERLVRIAFAVLCGLGILALVIGVTIARGEARGHAISHLVLGSMCLVLFAALAFPWHPTPGSGPALVRGLVLSLLALATFGSFVESLGGSGYDAANQGRRIAALAALHDVGVPLGVFVVAGVPIAILTGVVVAIGWGLGRWRPSDATS